MMRWIDAVRNAIRSLLGRRAFDTQLDADLQFHIEEAAAEYVREGLSPSDARRAALKAFGNPADVMEDVRDVALWTWWERLAQDLRHGLRRLRRTPAFAAIAVLSLALGIGATTAIFSIFNALVLRPLPIHDPAALFQVVHRGDGGQSGSSTYAFYERIAAQPRTTTGAFQVDPTLTTRVTVDGEVEAVVGQRVTGGYFGVLGVRPTIGRLIGPDDERGSTPNRVVVLGHAYWTRRFGRDAGVLGRTLTISDMAHTIIGVTPPEFFGLQVGRRVDLSVPIDGTDDPQYWKSRALLVRLAPGVTRQAAVTDLAAIFQQHLDADTTLSERARAQGFRSLELAPSSSGLPEFRDRYGKPVQAMLAIVAVLLTLGCANLASLFLARATARQRDLSVCLALGASRTRLARQALAETLIISLVGGALGVIAAFWAVDVLVGLLPDFGAPTDLQIQPDRNVLLFSLGVTMLTGLGISLAPTMLARKGDLRSMLSAGSRSVAPRGASFKALIVVQVALSTLLVVAATLFAVTLSNLKTQPLGFAPDGVLTLTVDADGTGLEGTRLTEVHREILQQLRSLPGVRHATLATIPPLSANEDGKPVAIQGITFQSADDGVLQVNAVGPDYFDTFGVRILQGRGITAADHLAAARVAVVSENMARHYFPGGDPVGRRMDVGRGRTGGQIEIVGVAADALDKDLRTAPSRMVYVPAFQREAEEEVVFAIQADSDAAALAPAARRAVQAVAPALLTSDIRTLVRQRDERAVNERLLALLSACLGGFALLLAGIGVYGVVAHSVTQRTAELGLRLALGAQRASLLWLVIRGTLTLVVVAVFLGVTAAFMTSSLLASFMYGVRPAEPWVYALTGALQITIGLLASVGPTLRAMHIDPVETLRSE